MTEVVEGARERCPPCPPTSEGVEALRERLAGLPSELPDEIAELRERFTAEELRKAAEAVPEGRCPTCTPRSPSVARRPSSACASRSGVDEQIEKVEGFYKDAQERAEGFVGDARERAEGFVGEAREAAEDALGKVSERTKAVGEQAAKLTGRTQAEVEDEVETVEAPATEADTVEAPAAEAPVAKAPAKKAPAKKAPANKAPAKKAPAKKAPAKKAQP